MRVTIADLRACGVCPQARRWFVQHDISWREFVQHGIEADELRKPGEFLNLIDRLEESARARDGQK